MDDRQWEKRSQRERAAREQAEQALETISQRLWQTNQNLEKARGELENEVAKRTRELSATVEHLEQEIAARRLAEDKLRSSRDQALEVSQMKVEFLGRMSHEIRTPLNAIIGFTGLLLESDLNGRQREQLSTVRSSGDLLLRIINDILDFSKIDAGKVDLEYSEFDLQAMVDETIALVQMDADEKNISIVAPTLSEPGTRLLLDSARIQQVLINLLTNALKYTDSGKITISADVADVDVSVVPEAVQKLGSRRHQRWARLDIAVDDTGIGISEKNQANMFDAFVQINPGSFSAGAGLGLSICKRLCQLMGGDISVESSPGAGSSFRFYVYGQVDEHLDHAQSNQRLDVTAPSVYLSSDAAQFPSSDMAVHKPLRILLADDYQVNRMIQQAQLEALGYRVDLVCNGEEVLRAVAARSYDVVLMDIRMPVMDGIEATRRLRESPNIEQPYIIAITASALAQDKGTYLEAGIDGYIAKPVNMQELASALDQAYAQRSSKPSEPSGPLEDVVLDHDALFRDLGEAASTLLAQVIPVFLRELPGRQKLLRESHKAGDAEQLAQILHGLKGASRSIGATDLAALCEIHENAARDGSLCTSHELDQMQELAQRTQQTLIRSL